MIVNLSLPSSLVLLSVWHLPLALSQLFFFFATCPIRVLSMWLPVLSSLESRAAAVVPAPPGLSFVSWIETLQADPPSSTGHLMGFRKSSAEAVRHDTTFVLPKPEQITNSRISNIPEFQRDKQARPSTMITIDAVPVWPIRVVCPAI